MIIEQKTNAVISKGIKGSVSFGIKQDGLAHIFNVLRNQLYSDKILAVLREYSCNAVDAHTEAGKAELPIRVTLPSLLAPELKIRDFGSGLTDLEINEIYAFYGESTKRKSNALIGQLGLGSKSAFAYGDNFLINSFVNGVKTSYNAFIDDSQVGQIAKMASSPTQEPNGVEIVIAVKKDDINAFENKAQKLYRYFPVKPEVLGSAEFSFGNESEVIYKNNFGSFSKNCASYGNRQSVAIMGCIGYIINPNAMNLSSDKEDDQICYRILNNRSGEFFFEIGELDIAASREGLQYTDKTINAIKSKIVKFHDGLRQHITDTLSTAHSYWASCKMFGNLQDGSNPLSIFQNVVQKVTWNNKVINHHAKFKTEDGVNYYQPRTQYRYRNNDEVVGAKKDYNVSGCYLTDDVVVIENTKDLKSGLTGYAFNFLKDRKKVLIVGFKSNADRKDFMTRTGMIDKDLVDIKTLQRLTLPRSTRASGVVVTRAKNNKHSKNVFVLNDTLKSSTWLRVKSECWEEKSIDINDPEVIKTHAWVELDRFVFNVGHREYNGLEILSALNSGLDTIAKQMNGSVVIPKVIGVKTKSVGELRSSKIKPLKEFVKEQLLNLEAQCSFGEILWGMEFYKLIQDENPVLCMSDKFDGKLFPNAKIVMNKFKSLLNKKSSLVKNASDQVTSMFHFSPTEIRKPASQALETLKSNVNKVVDVMKILKLIEPYSLNSYRGNSDNSIKIVEEFMQYRDPQLNGKLAKM
jgi:hypothetical protein